MFGAWHFCVCAKMPNVSIAVYVPPGRCPGLRATIGLTARPNHLTSVLHNVELVKIRATYQVAIKTIENVSCIFVKFVGYKNQEQNCLFSTDHLPAKLTDLPINIFSYARAGKPVSSPTIRKIIFIISKILFIICKIIFRLI